MTNRQAQELLQKIAAHKQRMTKRADDYHYTDAGFLRPGSAPATAPRTPSESLIGTIGAAGRRLKQLAGKQLASEGLRQVPGAMAQAATDAYDATARPTGQAIGDYAGRGYKYLSDAIGKGAPDAPATRAVAKDKTDTLQNAASDYAKRDIGNAFMLSMALGAPLAGLHAWRRLQRSMKQRGVPREDLVQGKKRKGMPLTEYDMLVPGPEKTGASKWDKVYYPAGITGAVAAGGFTGMKLTSALIDKFYDNRRKKELDAKRQELQRSMRDLYASPTREKLAAAYRQTCSEKSANVLGDLLLNNQVTRYGLAAGVPLAMLGAAQQYAKTRKDDPARLVNKALKRRAAARERTRPSDLYAVLADS